MKPQTIRAFKARIAKLDQDESEVHYNWSQLAKDIRGKFNRGEAGDQKFVAWFVEHAEMNSYRANAMLEYVQMAKHAPTKERWNLMGGFNALRSLVQHPAELQTTIIDRWTGSSKALVTIIREVTRELHPAVTVERRYDTLADLTALANYVARSGKAVPANIYEIVQRRATPGVRTTTTKTVIRAVA